MADKHGQAPACTKVSASVTREKTRGGLLFFFCSLISFLSFHASTTTSRSVVGPFLPRADSDVPAWRPFPFFFHLFRYYILLTTHTHILMGKSRVLFEHAL